MSMPARRWLALITLAVAVAWPVIAATPSGIWLDVPYVRQPREGCGAACIAMVMEYWALKDPAYRRAAPGVEAIQHTLFSPAAHGIFASAMERYLRSQGMRVYPFSGSWSVLRDHLLKGRPLIVCLREGGLQHYVVVAGITKDAVLVNDPAGEKLEPVRRSAFERKWASQNDWTLLAVPEP